MARNADLVSDPAVDIVYVATPHPQHEACALLALTAGKHVLVEKPFALNAMAASRVIEEANKQNRIVLEAMWTRFLPHMKRIHEIIQAGILGDLRSVAAEHRQSLPTDPEHRLNALELGGGALLDLGIYPISFAIDILGMPTAVSAVARFTGTGVDAEISTLMHHANGTISTTVSALDLAKPNGASIFGSKARVEIDPSWYGPTSFRVIDHKGVLIEQYNGSVSGRGMQFQAFEMERLVRMGATSSIMPPPQTIDIMKVLDDIRRQIGLRYPVESGAS